jgi:hypothetical protein
MDIADICAVIKQLELDYDQTPPFSAEVKEMCKHFSPLRVSEYCGN